MAGRIAHGPLPACVWVYVHSGDTDLAKSGNDAFFLALAAIEQAQQSATVTNARCPSERIPKGAFAFGADHGPAKMRAEPVILDGFFHGEDGVSCGH